MYSKGFIALLTGTASGQPYWLANSIDWVAHITQQDTTLFNTLFALIQVSIGLGLLYRRTVKPALALSFAWALGVWWFSEGFGMLFAGTANPLTGAPGAVLLYAIIGLLVWPGERTGGLLGARGARAVWATLWLVTAWSWLLAPNSRETVIKPNVHVPGTPPYPGSGLHGRVAEEAHPLIGPRRSLARGEPAV
jgi:hypothetical protein